MALQTFSFVVAGVYSCFLSCRPTQTQHYNTCLKTILILTAPENSRPYTEHFPVPRDSSKAGLSLTRNEEELLHLPAAPGSHNQRFECSFCAHSASLSRAAILGIGTVAAQHPPGTAAGTRLQQVLPEGVSSLLQPFSCGGITLRCHGGAKGVTGSLQMRLSSMCCCSLGLLQLLVHSPAAASGACLEK